MTNQPKPTSLPKYKVAAGMLRQAIAMEAKAEALRSASLSMVERLNPDEFNQYVELTKNL